MEILEENYTCNLCNGKEFALLKNIHQIDKRILKCKNCGLVFADPLNTKFWTCDFEEPETRQQRYSKITQTAIAEGKHNEDILKLEEDIKALHFASRKKEINRYVQSGRLLDIGCGRGFFLTNFISNTFDFWGVEPREKICEEAQKKVGRDRIFCGTLRESGFPDSYFNVVTMINLIEHLPNPKETLEEVNRITKRDGLLLIETPNIDSIIPKLFGIKWHAFLEREHHYFFSINTLKKLLEATGFTVRRVKRGNKLFSIRYLIYRISWYSKKGHCFLEKITHNSALSSKTLKIPQIDEIILIAQKVRDIKTLL